MTLPFESVFISLKIKHQNGCVHGLAVFVETGKDIEVVLVALSTDKALFYGFFYCTAWLMLVGAVGETAVVEAGTHLREEMREFLPVEVHHAELLDAGSVDEISDE